MLLQTHETLQRLLDHVHVVLSRGSTTFDAALANEWADNLLVRPVLSIAHLILEMLQLHGVQVEVGLRHGSLDAARVNRGELPRHI